MVGLRSELGFPAGCATTVIDPIWPATVQFGDEGDDEGFAAAALTEALVPPPMLKATTMTMMESNWAKPSNDTREASDILMMPSPA